VQGKSFAALPATPPAFQDPIVSYDVAFCSVRGATPQGNALTARRFDGDKILLDKLKPSPY
jgi:hypothetical protein